DRQTCELAPGIACNSRARGPSRRAESTHSLRSPAPGPAILRRPGRPPRTWKLDDPRAPLVFAQYRAHHAEIVQRIRFGGSVAAPPARLDCPLEGFQSRLVIPQPAIKAPKIDQYVRFDVRFFQEGGDRKCFIVDLERALILGQVRV